MGALPVTIEVRTMPIPASLHPSMLLKLAQDACMRRPCSSPVCAMRCFTNESIHSKASKLAFHAWSSSSPPCPCCWVGDPDGGSKSALSRCSTNRSGPVEPCSGPARQDIHRHVIALAHQCIRPTGLWPQQRQEGQETGSRRMGGMVPVSSIPLSAVPHAFGQTVIYRLTHLVAG